MPLMQYCTLKGRCCKTFPLAFANDQATNHQSARLHTIAPFDVGKPFQPYLLIIQSHCIRLCNPFSRSEKLVLLANISSRASSYRISPSGVGLRLRCSFGALQLATASHPLSKIPIESHDADAWPRVTGILSNDQAQGCRRLSPRRISDACQPPYLIWRLHYQECARSETGRIKSQKSSFYSNCSGLVDSIILISDLSPFGSLLAKRLSIAQ
jgi:hypothetical protein